jgi:DNA-nicking Smr family endonuclease
MARKPQPDELRLWGLVTSTVRPHEPKPARRQHKAVVTADAPLRLDPNAEHKPSPPPQGPPDPIEPNRRRRIVVQARGEPLPRLDLHGMDQVAARRALGGFLGRAYADHVRAVLVITGKGVQGDGVLRRRLPEWLAEPELRLMVAGLSSADPHHGGAGAVYVALKRRSR